MRTPLIPLLCCLLLLSACGGPVLRPKVDTPPQAEVGAEQVQQILAQARQSASPERERLQFKAATLLLEAEQYDLVSQLLEPIDPRQLSLSLEARYAIVQSRLLIHRGDYEGALAVLESERLLTELDNLPLPRQLTISLLRAEVYARLGSHIASARQRIFIAPLLPPDRQFDNRKAIWHSLMYVPREELRHYLSSSLSGEYRGWLELALIAKENQGDLDQQVAQLDSWQQRWSQHPANEQLPGGLELIRELAANRPQRVALLLPLSGKLAPYGKAVRDGFIAALYQTRQQGGEVPELRVYDTETSSDSTALYYQAVDAGAELVVGPLEKHRVRLLFDELSLPVPTLALNRVEDYGVPPANLFQFGLAPQDEARQVAEIAYLENRRQAMVIAPAGEWGDKVKQSFNKRWAELGGRVAAESIYTGQKDYSSSIKHALQLDISEQRASRIQRLVGEHIEFTPRRRQDVDMVFLLARPQQARSLNPLLAYHYAADLPVYGTSRLYAGYDAPDKDRDINGVRFTDMPWVLGQPSSLHRQIDNEIANSKAFQRMYALGVDSFQLHPRLRQLLEIPNSRMYGHTGTLKLNPRGEIERDMLLAEIKGSRAKLVPVANQSLDGKDAEHAFWKTEEH